jgi:hypothetical protein
MNGFESVSKPLRWLMVLLLVAFVAGCGDGGGNGSSAKAITVYSLAGITGTINETAKTISVTLPNGTNKTALIATFTTTGTSVKVGTTVQTSATTANNFTSPVTYTVTAGDSSTATYTVTVIIASSSAKAITAYSLAGATGIINEAAKTIAVTMPSGTNVTALVATYTTTGASVKIGTVTQTNPAAAHDFTIPVVAYIVTAADATTATYTVTVTVALATDKAITTYSFAEYPGAAGTITEPAHTIAVTVPKGTNVTALVATFTTTGASVTVGTPSVAQVSGTTANNFTSPVAYIVTDANSSTVTYNVTVTVATALGPAPVNLGTAGNFVILTKSGITNVHTSAITGNIGSSPITAAAMDNVFCSGPVEITGTIYGVDATYTGSGVTTCFAGAAGDKTTVDNAVLDMGTAFTDAAGRTVPAAVTELGAGNISGKTITPGLYKWSTGVLITSAGVTLSGGASDVWIFQIAQNLTVNNGAIVHLSGGALAKNIFWQVSGQATLGTTVDFNGIILSQTLISLNTGAALHGRALAQTAVTLNKTTVGP